MVAICCILMILLLQKQFHKRLQVHLEQFETTIPLEKSLREK